MSMIGRSVIMAAVLAAGSFQSISACPFCSASGQTLLQAVDESDVAFIAELSGSKALASATPGGPDGETQAKILQVLKTNDALGGRSEVTLPRYIPAAETATVTYLVYALASDGVIDPYRASPVDSKDFITYMAGAVEIRKRTSAERVAYFFEYLDHSDPNIANDAYSEFAVAPYKDVHAAKEAFKPERIIGWLENPRTEPYRMGLYGLLLGICGRPEDKMLLLGILEDPKRRPISGVDGLLGGLCVLDPKAGSEFTLRVLTTPENDFNYRYAALRTVKFLLSDMPEVEKDGIFQAMASAVSHADITDLIIDEFRRNGVWTITDKVLALYTDPAFNIQVVKRAVVRYALKCPDDASGAFIKDLREKDGQFVADVEEVLRFEEAQQVKLKDPSS
jgi:hypothetical protein